MSAPSPSIVSPETETASEPGEESRRHALLFMLEDLEENREKIEMSRREWTRAFDAIRDPVFIHDQDYRIVRANSAYAARAGMGFRDLIGKLYWEAFPKRAGPLPRCRITTEDKEDSVTEEFILDTGEIFVSRSFVIRDAGHRFIYAVHVLEDVTEDRRAETERRLLSEALRQSGAGLILLNTDMSFRYANPAACKLAGYEPGQLDGKPIATVIPAHLLEQIPVIREAVERTGLWTGEIMLATQDGSVIPIYLSGASIMDGSGKIIAYVGSWLDMRPIKEAQAALAASEARFRLLAENASDLITVVSAEGRLRYISPSVQRLLGYGQDEIIGRDMTEFLHPDDMAGALSALAQGIAEPDTIQSLNHRIRRKDGSWRHFETLGRNLLHEPAVGGIVLNSRDVTERKEAEAKVREVALFPAENPNPVMRVGADGLLRYANEASARLLEYYSVAASGKVPENWAATAAEALGTAQKHELEIQCLERIYAFVVAPIMDAGYVNFYGTDVTERRRGEAELRLFRALLDNSSDAIEVIDPPSMGLLDVNARECRDLGYSREELLSMTIADIDPNFDQPGMKEIGKQIRQSGTALFESLHRRKDGSTFPVEISLQLVEIGRPYLISICRDITERKQAEENLRLANAVVESSPTMLFRWKAAEGWPVEYVSQNVAQLGYSATELLTGAVSYSAIVHPDDLSRVASEVARHSAAGAEHFTQEYRMVTRAGNVRWIDDRTVVERDAAGNVTHYQGIVIDITERKQAEYALQESLVQTIRAIALTVEKRDPYTAGHQQRVSELCVAIGMELGLEKDFIEGLRLGALIHDIGKISIPAEILNRPGRLTETEFEIIMTHPQIGYDIVKDVKFPWPVAEMILQHHERLDGSGYPRALKDGQIILEARILSVADVAEAMSSHRPYRAALGIDIALKEIETNMGKLYDLEIAKTCIRLFREKGFAFPPALT